MTFTLMQSWKPKTFSSGYEIKSTKESSAACTQTPDKLLLLKSLKLCYPINDQDVNIEIETEKVSSTASDSLAPSEKSKSSTASDSSRTQSKLKRRKITKSNSKGSEIVQPSFEEPRTPQWLTENQLLLRDISIEQNNLIRFYENPLNELLSSNAVGCVSILNDPCS